MFWAVRQLAVPLKYLRIQSGETWAESKAVYDFAFPIILTAASAGFCWLLGVPLSVSKLTGLSDGLSTLLALLIGFYMAALAAVATLQRDGLDQPLKGDPAKLRNGDNDDGTPKYKELSYRQFISYLFGYLSFLSLILYVALLVLSKVWPIITMKWNLWLCGADIIPLILEPGLFLAVVFSMWQLLIVSLLGIYFLSERLQSLTDK